MALEIKIKIPKVDMLFYLYYVNSRGSAPTVITCDVIPVKKVNLEEMTNLLNRLKIPKNV